jgi:Ca2+-binding EF-hand superfamily protein
MELAVWTFLVHFMVTRKEQQKLYTTFSSFNINNHGTIELSELINGFLQPFPLINSNRFSKK